MGAHRCASPARASLLSLSLAALLVRLGSCCSGAPPCTQRLPSAIDAYGTLLCVRSSPSRFRIRSGATCAPLTCGEGGARTQLTCHSSPSNAARALLGAHAGTSRIGTMIRAERAQAKSFLCAWRVQERRRESDDRLRGGSSALRPHTRADGDKRPEETVRNGGPGAHLDGACARTRPHAQAGRCHRCADPG